MNCCISGSVEGVSFSLARRVECVWARRIVFPGLPGPCAVCVLVLVGVSRSVGRFGGILPSGIASAHLVVLKVPLDRWDRLGSCLALPW